MFLFIGSWKTNSVLVCYSNTSHVLIYPQNLAIFALHLNIQIHLMFLFILNELSKEEILSGFKYISCSYLSSHSSLGSLKVTSFKYISCSYLSYSLPFRTGSSAIQIHLMFLFISALHSGGVVAVNHSNTSHVLIYPKKISSGRMLPQDSNTSHVLIYLKGIDVSYHNGIIFKYISCSYLSPGRNCFATSQ